MMNLSTLFFLVNTDSEKEESSQLPEEMNLIEDLDSENLFKAPDEAVKKVLGFAASYMTMKSSYLDEMEMFKN
jgi:hypothetical protein